MLYWVRHSAPLATITHIIQVVCSRGHIHRKAKTEAEVGAGMNPEQSFGKPSNRMRNTAYTSSKEMLIRNR